MKKEILIRIDLVGDVRLLWSVRQRLTGLLGSTRDTAPVLLFPCASIHTFGMRYPIDVAFVDTKGQVVACKRAVKPRRKLSDSGALAVLERPCSDDTWPNVGDELHMVLGGELHDKD